MNGRKVKGGGKGKEWSGGKVGRKRWRREEKVRKRTLLGGNNFQRADSG